MTEKLNVHQRLAAVMADVKYIQKEEKKGMQYRVVSHDKVTALVRPALLSAGIVYYPVRCDHCHNGNRAECSMTVRFVNIDEPSDFFDVPTFGYGIDGQDKGPGKAMSYAVKYALLKALGLETGDDPDLESVDHDKNDPAKPTESELHEKRREWISATMAKASDRAKLKHFRDREDVSATWDGLPDDMRATLDAEYNGLWNSLQEAAA